MVSTRARKAQRSPRPLTKIKRQCVEVMPWTEFVIFIIALLALSRVEAQALPTWVSEEFDSGFPSGWDYSAGWMQLPGAISTSEHTRYFGVPGDWTDLTISLWLRRSGDNEVQVRFRSNDNDSYQVAVGAEQVALARLFHNDANPLRPRESRAITSTGDRYNLTIIAEAERIVVLVNGVQILDYNEADDSHGGQVVVINNGIGDLAVERLDILPPDWSILETGVVPSLQPAAAPTRSSEATAQPTAAPTLLSERTAQPAGANGDCTVGTTVRGGVNIRRGPGTGYAVKGYLIPGETLPVTGTNNGWYRVTFFDEAGWVGGSVATLAGSCDAIPFVPLPPATLVATAAPPGTQPAVSSVLADITITDIYPDPAPAGAFNFRLTNNGPSTLTNAGVTIRCEAIITYTGANTVSTTTAPPSVYVVSLAPGETKAFVSPLVFDVSAQTATVNYQTSCAVESVSFLETNTADNRYSELIALTP